MKIIQDECLIKEFDSGLISRYLGGMSLGVFDIETLGLNPQYCPIVLAGFLEPDAGGACRITQYFAEVPEDESLIIKRIQDDLSRVDYILTYNGRHFDIPFVEKRAEKLGVPGPFSVYDLDLYMVLNGYSQVKFFMKNLRQKTVERFMGLDIGRDDMISGAESIELYERFIRCENPDERSMIQNKILLHNHDDIIQLYKIMPILMQTDIHRAFYSLGFPVKGVSGWPTLCVSSIRTGTWGISVSGIYGGEGFSYMAYDSFTEHFSCEFREDNHFKFDFRTERHKGNVFLNLRLYLDDLEKFRNYPHFINGFLHVTDGRSAHYMEINTFVREFLKKFMEDTVCPLMIL